MLILLMVVLVSFGWPIFKAVEYSRRGGTHRLVGIFTSFLLGGVCTYLGYFVAFEGFIKGTIRTTYPVSGWILLIIGGLYVLGGIFTSAFGNKKKSN